MITLNAVEGTIPRRHPVRNEFAGCSSGPVYYSTKGNGVNAFDAVLQTYRLGFSRTEIVEMSGDVGRAEFSIVNEFDRDVGRALITWYRMPSGRYEIVGYIA